MSRYSFFWVVLFIIVTVSTEGNSQKKVFHFNQLNNSIPELRNIFSQSNVCEFNVSSLNDHLATSRSGASEVTLKIDENRIWTFTIEPVQIVTDKTVVYTLHSDGKKKIEILPEIQTYKGRFTDGRPGDIRLTVHGDFMYGLIRNDSEELFIEPMKYFTRSANKNAFVIYDTKSILPEHKSKPCFRPKSVDQAVHANHDDVQSRTGACYTVKLALLADYSMYTDPAHSGLDAVIDHVVGVMNNVQTNYEYNGTINFDDGINYEISEIVVSTCATCDPLSSTQNANTLLSEFSSWVDMGGFDHAFNAAHFWSNRDFIGTTVGLAFTQANLYCQSRARAILEDWTSTAALLKTMVAHEMGHNFNGVHDGTTGMILSPTVSVTNTWSTGSKATINTQIASQSSCLDACSSQTCNRVQNVLLSGITAQGFTLDWTHSTENLYTIKIREVGSDTFLQELTTINNHLVVTPVGFEICKKYDVFVYNECGSQGLSAPQRILFQGLTSQGCAEFASNKSVTWPGGTISMTDKSLNAGTWHWDFGNGQTSTLQNPSVTYTDPGFYNVTLTVNNGVHSMVKNELIKVLPHMPIPFETSSGGDFESNTNLFSSEAIEGTVNLWQSGTSNYVLATQGNAWKTILNGDILQVTGKCALYSPKFDFSQYASSTLHFDIGMETVYCNAPFAVQLQYSTDQGVTWTRLGSAPDFYNGGPGEFCEIASQIFSDKYGWALNQNYLHKSIDVSFLSGQTSVIFRFVASTSGIFNGGYNIDGVLIDNFRIDALGFIPLALDVTSLSGQAVNNTTKLRWTASNSIDLETFYVNRSKDGLSFEQIGFIKSQNGLSEYSFDDLFPEKGTQYYQIVSKDFSGENRFSNIIKINHGVEQTLKFYPNPTGVNEYFTIKGSDGASDFINIQIIDMFGRSIYDKSTLVKSKGKVSIDKPGIYIIQAESAAGEIHSGKIIIY